MLKCIQNIIDKLADSNRLPEKEELITLPGVFGKEYNEGFITSWLAYLLNPRVNGFGMAPLNALLKYAGAPAIDEEEDISIAQEYTFKDSGRRIDLLILTKDLVIGIENKIQSGEQEYQTIDYWRSLNSLCKTKDDEQKIAYGIYLKPNWNTSIPCDDFITITYKDLLSALKAIEYDHSRDHRKNFYFYEFILYAEEILMTNSVAGFPIMKDNARIYMQGREIIEAAKSSLDNYIKELGSWLENQMKELAPHLIVDSPKPTYWQIRENDAWKNLNFHYELFWEGTRKKSIAELTQDDQNVLLCMHLEGANQEVKNRFRKARDKRLNEINIHVDFNSEEKALDSINKIIRELQSDNFKEQARIADECIRLFIE